MKNNKFSIIVLSVLITASIMLSGCTFIDNLQVKMKLKNEQFEYIKQNRIDKIVIQNGRDSGFRFVVTDNKAITDIYKILADGKEVSKRSSLDPDYVFEVYIGEEIKKYQYVVGDNDSNTGNFYDDDKAFSVPKNLENTIMQNLSFIRKPRNFEYIYYQSILKVIQDKKDVLSKAKKVGIDINGDTDCLKYIFSVDLEEFKKNLNNALPNVALVNNDSGDFDTVIKVKNRGYNSTIFKTLITIENKIDKSSDRYYIMAEYNYKDWDIKISEPNKAPQGW
ncbi:hypothetical protein CLPUN_06020 [Clostridium puniceum]|uniref:YhfM-like domain-containing protein n=1 Tax=Clostridium puniceum TaxID=29367 RepID=A0A1S8TWJ0_9CLOT|nr:hypothetical protein [Clostridium puniceum]OOM82106.1 hypothetical protein CLPUN_06020 [Clostridium puniceum]